METRFFFELQRTNMSNFLGIDGCKSGWIVATIHHQLELKLISALQQIQLNETDTLWIDMPIGLPKNQSRDCDAQLRKALGKKGASAFGVPVRDAVFAESYQEASAINFAQIGKKISKQSWNICPKIRQVDTWLHEQSHLKNLVFESHPEFVFLNWSGDYFESKKTAEGFAQRLAFLESKFPCKDIIEQFLNHTKRKECNADDVLDAVVLALRARSYGDKLSAYFGDDAFKIHF